MAVKTTKVQGRRRVRYESYDDLLADARNVATQPHRALGNWSAGQIMQHLAMAIDTSIDGSGVKLPFPVKWLLIWFKKQQFLYKSLPPGFKSSSRFVPAETSVEQGLAALQAAIDRQSQESRRAIHPAFGQLSAAEWTAFNLRHSEMHMSFLIPDGH